jgi:hypothetical protein
MARTYVSLPKISSKKSLCSIARSNSLFSRANSLVHSQKFPVLLSREFHCKPLNLLACQRPSPVSRELASGDGFDWEWRLCCEHEPVQLPTGWGSARSRTRNGNEYYLIQRRGLRAVFCPSPTRQIRATRLPFDRRSVANSTWLVAARGPRKRLIAEVDILDSSRQLASIDQAVCLYHVSMRWAFSPFQS